jgi:DNA polymerase III delta prime subunit
MELLSLDQIIGQDRPLKLIRGLLTDIKRFPRLVILDGPPGTGKTSIINYLASVLDKENISYTISNELSSEHHTTFMEVQDYDKLPETTRSRACRIHLNKVNQKDMVGYLMALCSKNNIGFTVEGLNRVVRKSRGNIRQAKNFIATLSKIGKISRESVNDNLENNEDEIAYKTFTAVATGNLEEAMAICEEQEDKTVINYMFSYYGKCFFDKDEYISKEETRIREAIRSSFPETEKVTTLFLKWNVQTSVDILPLFLYELSKCVTKIKAQVKQVVLEDSPQKNVEPEDNSDIMQMFKGRIKVLGDI